MNIKTFFNITNTDHAEFNKNLDEAINKLQSDNQRIEIQYTVNSFPNGQLVYSALVLGRK